MLNLLNHFKTNHSKNIMIIGVTGNYGSGKDTVAEILEKRGYTHISLSDLIREELKERGKEITRENLIGLGNELRKCFGPETLAKLASQKIQKGNNFVLTSIRNPSEVDFFLKRKDFVLVNVVAPIDARLKRLISRNRENDPKTLEELKEKEKRENSKNKDNQQLNAVAKKAKIIIKNDRTLEELNEKVNNLLFGLRKTFPRPSFEDIYMKLAKTFAERSTCLRLQVGTVITSLDYRRVLAVGYNGNATNLPNRCDRSTPGNCGCLHSEENAVINCDSGRMVKKAVFVTHLPCVMCTKRLINLGNVKKVYFHKDYRIKDSLKLLTQVGIKYKKI